MPRPPIHGLQWPRRPLSAVGAADTFSPRGKAFSFRKRVILDVDRSLMLTVAVGAGAAELTVGAGGSAAGAERLGVNAAAVQILRHIDEKSVQMVADAAQLGRVGQRAFGVQRQIGRASCRERV